MKKFLIGTLAGLCPWAMIDLWNFRASYADVAWEAIPVPLRVTFALCIVISALATFAAWGYGLFLGVSE